ncbi:bifunctional glycosyltransferase/class I SAM-dependent methyltransferase [Candidatus Kuenenia sp.]|uniref:bifunctional glycosyltransferase/class I SAM-dependent methyltransferase n=1 Tax=Candidatus Kuenenia sp. TaxID=2499824 RepID=UPI00321FDA5C
MNNIKQLALEVLQNNRVAVFTVAYNAEQHIEDVLNRIPKWVAEKLAEIYIIDDRSTDDTYSKARNIQWPKELAPLRIFQTPYNQGYGGNQKLGYNYAIQRGFDIVVLLHGDGQYAPESLPHILAAYTEKTDAVFGSRFLQRGGALKGRMPLYKWIGNRILTKIQNTLLKSQMSEMHSGYRSYRVSALRKIPFNYNSQGFDFDADIIVQFHAAGFKIKEIPIPTHYGDEVCRVNGVAYAWNCIKTLIKYRLMNYEIFYDPKFDVRAEMQYHYTSKSAKSSLHYYVRNLPIEKGKTLLDIGGGAIGAVSMAHAERGVGVTVLDQCNAVQSDVLKHYVVNLDEPWGVQFPAEKYDFAFSLDVLEHLNCPEKGAKEIFNLLKSGGKLYASTGNVAFFILRLMLCYGSFNYGRRGILDLTHKRLMTVNSFRRLLENSGFKVEKIMGFGVPLLDMNGSSKHMALLDMISFRLARIWPRLFAFQILAICHRPDSIEDLMEQTFQNN